MHTAKSVARHMIQSGTTVASSGLVHSRLRALPQRGRAFNLTFPSRPRLSARQPFDRRCFLLEGPDNSTWSA